MEIVEAAPVVELDTQLVRALSLFHKPGPLISTNLLKDAPLLSFKWAEEHRELYGREVEFSGDEEDDGTVGSEATVSASLTLGGLEQLVDGLQEAVGLARGDPGEDALEVVTDHGGNLLHRFDLGSHDIGTPWLE